MKMSSSFFPTGKGVGERFPSMNMNRQRSAVESVSSSTGGKSNSSRSLTPTTQNRPRRITMAGMIYDANRILEQAMDPKKDGLHPGLFDPDLLGIAFMTVWEAGLIFSGNVGTGIVLARNPMDPNSWSPPAAVGLSSVGAGLMGGISMKHIVYLIYDYYTLESMSGENGIVVSSQVEASVFKFGRHAEISAIATAKGICKNIALSYDNRGIFGGISIEGGIMKGRWHVNERFYGKKGIKTADILFSGEKFEIPSITLLPELYTKLQKLCSGSSVYEPTTEELKKIMSTQKEVEEEEKDAAQHVSFYMATEGDETLVDGLDSQHKSSDGENADTGSDRDSENSAKKNQACSSSSVTQEG
mmetsp:Transcript_22958/g.54473  ORF Transcript_22958/g.54473 Transcript_22958/m.54473 type:complete len:358 (+) Transcript_22958:1475-2548(+)